MRYFTWKLEFVLNILWLVIDQFECTEFNQGALFLYFRQKMLFGGEFGPKNQNYQFTLKFAT